MSQKESKILKTKALNSILLSVEHFNRLEDRGRNEVVLLLLGHAFEMLLKAAILRNDVAIREKGISHTISFDRALKISLSRLKFLNQDQALVLQTINSLGNAAQHHHVSLSEAQLYFHAQSGLTLFRDLLRKSFSEDLASHMPERMLPISTVAITDSINLFSQQVDEVKKLLQPGKRRKAEALARIRGLAIMDYSLRGETMQPSEKDLSDIGNKILTGHNFESVFPGIGAVNFSSDGEGTTFNLRLTKKEGIAVQISSDIDDGTPVIAIKTVNDFDFYNIRPTALAKKVGLTQPKTTAAIYILNLKKDPESFKEFAFGKTVLAHYSKNAITKINELLVTQTPEQIWETYKRRSSPR